tara:strand:+ start:3369 stop:3590 length:222 start_codon:yes stop_codon:yes gene_type:complete
MKTNRPTLIKIGIVAAVLVAVVLYLRQQKEKESETEAYKFGSKRVSARTKRERAKMMAAARARKAGKSAKKWR